MATASQLDARIASLEEAIGTGALRVKSGERDVTFRSLAEMQQSLAMLKSDRAKLDNVRRTRTLRPITGMGC